MSRPWSWYKPFANKDSKAERDYLNRKLKAQFKSADVFAAKTLITLGESEVESGQVTVKNNQNPRRSQVSLETISQNFSEIFEKTRLLIVEKLVEGTTPDLFLLQNDKIINF